ncbi:MAG TPA: LemA family protein [Anaerovoracaceae bacterium]|nr:LemA family protein [Anaerovoracaceae bacterium]
MYTIAVVGVLLIAISFWMLSVQRSLVGMDENIKSAMEQIGVLISAQWDILTSLLDLTEWYATHGCENIIETMNARRSITKYSLPEAVMNQEKIIAKTIREFQDAAEGYPDLKADPNYVKTMEALRQYENMVQRSMQVYDDTVAKLDRTTHMFPSSVFAAIFGFSNHPYLNPAER